MYRKKESTARQAAGGKSKEEIHGCSERRNGAVVREEGAEDRVR